ncbi:hypothetical protein [Thomasclavelia ramosa]|uniref:hypothetical protein n=3 Tax=Thomasclavelia ramosa TaxID=1547 RepID=UPI0031B64A58
MLAHSEDIILKNLRQENNPILWANYLIYSQYDSLYNSTVLHELEKIIDDNISNMISYEPMLQREFWYVLIFCNCPYLSIDLKNKLKDKVNELHLNGSKPCDKASNLIYEFLSTNKSNLFFFWGYYRFNASKQLTYRTYQRTLFKQYKNKKNFEFYGSLDS